MRTKGDIYPRVTEGYIVAGNPQHLGGWWFRSELLHIIKCAENTLRLYDEENITDDYIKALDMQAMLEEASGWMKSKKTPKKKIEDDLYLILDTSSNKLKIGRSKNVKKRLQQLQTSNSGSLSLLFSIKGKGCYEEDVHKKFSHLNSNGEWYEYDNSIIDYFNGGIV